MSAYIVSREHIDLLVKTALSGPKDGMGNLALRGWRFMQDYGRDHVTADAVGQCLIDENVASVRYRYPDHADGLPGPTDAYYAQPYQYRDPEIRLTVVEALKAIHNYRYQACEHPGWDASLSARLCQTLEQALVRTLPGYEDAPWGFEAEDIEARR